MRKQFARVLGFSIVIVLIVRCDIGFILSAVFGK